MFLLAILSCIALVQSNGINYDQPYKFGYSIKDKYSQQHRDEISNGAGDVKGSYGYVDAKGVYRKVEYVADEGGFRAEIKTNEPGTANQDPAYVKIQSNNPYSQKYEGYGNDMNRYQYGGYGNDMNRYQYGGYGNDRNRYQYGGYGNDNNRYQYGNEMNSYKYGNEMGGYGYGGYGNAMGGYRYGGYNRGNQYGYGDSSRNYGSQGGYDNNMNYGSGSRNYGYQGRYEGNRNYGDDSGNYGYQGRYENNRNYGAYLKGGSIRGYDYRYGQRD
ncbi:uncharacterized protein CDAR_279501 [Caerostris darwini]|uniref:Uncharacterized protein n=1 Tax=Caerostris darwini TaxID=1538125 RepID=A0AAV4VMD4_9ARAC|nr:uncharacterized protein CDAR_279501 [Caerostris darwini]